MKKIYSKVKPSELLHIFHKFADYNPGSTTFLTDEKDLLQAAVVYNPPIGHKFKGPHKHIPCERKTNETYESFIIYRGKVKVTLYDLDESKLGEEILESGDLYTITGKGGHGFEVLTSDTIFFELKNGPYFGADKDKVFFTPKF